MTSEEVRAFYSHIQNEPYFLDLVTYMTSGPSIAIVLAKVTPGYSAGKKGSARLRYLNGGLGPKSIGLHIIINYYHFTPLFR